MNDWEKPILYVRFCICYAMLVFHVDGKKASKYLNYNLTFKLCRIHDLSLQFKNMVFLVHNA